MAMINTKTIDKKQVLLNELSKESEQLLGLAYLYAKNFNEYGEDITKAWTTAVQQTSVIREVSRKAWAEAYDSFKADYEARLKADMVAMLTELHLEIEELCINNPLSEDEEDMNRGIEKAADVIQEKIDSLKAGIKPQESEDNNGDNT